MHQGSRSLQDDVPYADYLNRKAEVGFASNFGVMDLFLGKDLKYIAVVNVFFFFFVCVCVSQSLFPRALSLDLFLRMLQKELEE